MRSKHTWLALYIPVLFIGTLRAATPAKPDSVVENYLAATSQQEHALQGSSMEVDIEASLPKLKRQGRLQGLRRISRLGRITYEVLHFEGDNAVKNQVIARYLSAEVEAQSDDSPSLAVTPANYKFSYKGPLTSNGRQVEVFQVAPRHKAVGLFKGEIWIDSQTFLCVREAGRMVKNPSIFLKRIEFVKEYGIQAGVSVPQQIHSLVATRIVGPAELTVSYRNVALADSLAAGTGPTSPSGAAIIDVGDQ